VGATCIIRYATIRNVEMCDNLPINPERSFPPCLGLRPLPTDVSNFAQSVNSSRICVIQTARIVLTERLFLTSGYAQGYSDARLGKSSSVSNEPGQGLVHNLGNQSVLSMSSVGGLCDRMHL
jgi:hypothetical protein